MGHKKKKRKERQLEQSLHTATDIDATNNYNSHTKIPRWQYLIPPAILSVLTILFYAPSMRYDFQFDDIANIKKFFHIRHYGLSSFFFKTTRWISGWMNTIHYSISKFDPISYRIGNLLIHTASGLLVFFILFLGLKRLKQENFFSKNYFSIAFLSAILFLLHPVQTQTVSYVIQGQLEGLAAFFILAMTFLFLKLCYANKTSSKRIYTFLLFVVAAFSCGTKEIAIISPALILLIDWFFVAQGDWNSLKKRAYIHIPLTLLIIAVYIYFLKPTFFTEILGLKRIAKNNIGNVITQNPLEAITPWIFFRSQFKVILHYLWIFIYPFSISVEYDWVLSKSFFAFDCIVPCIILLLMCFALFRLFLKNRASLIVFAGLWFFVSIAPRSSIIPSPELLVDYKTYTASFGWLFLLASAIIFVFQYIKNRIQTTQQHPALTQQSTHKKTLFNPLILSILIGVGAGYLTLQRNTIWRSGLEFWGDMIKHAPGKARAYNNYGVELSQNKRDFQGSIPFFKKAISMDSKYPDPWNNLAVAYANTGELDNAIHALKQSIRIYPLYPENYNNLASFYIQKDELDEAEKLLKTALRLRDYYGKAYFNLGRIHFARGEHEKAWQCFKKCCTECDFDNTPHGFATYAKVSMMLKKYDDAIFGYQKALSFDPNYPDAAFNLANAYYLSKQYDQAISLYNKLIEHNPTDMRAQYNMGEAYLAQEQYQQALTCYQKTQGSKQLPYAHLRVALCLKKLGKTNQAKHLLEQVVAQSSNNNAQIEMVKVQARKELAQLT